ncbi:MAG: hypothetical protein MUF51_00555 [Vicinamibacteria bacterium]|jgi:hypothetical protein|nr:hypothetical protein [Vicinamibacteria bacterium]
MSIEIRSDQVDVNEIMRLIRKRIEEKRQGLYTEEEIRQIAEHRLDAVLDAHEFNSDLITDFRTRPARWNYSFDPESIYRSSRGGVGGVLALMRRILRPVQKLFWNPSPMIAALSRQADLNNYYVHLLHSFAVEATRLNLEVQALKNRVLELKGQVEFQARREKTLEDMVVYRPEASRSEDVAAPAGERKA